MLQGNIDKLFIVFFTINKVKKNVVWRSRITIFQSPIIIRFYLQFLTTSFDFLFCLSILILLNSRIFFSFLIKSICCINTLIRVFILLNLFLFGHIFSSYFWWVKTSKNNLNYWRLYFFFNQKLHLTVLWDAFCRPLIANLHFGLTIGFNQMSNVRSRNIFTRKCHKSYKLLRY